MGMGLRMKRNIWQLGRGQSMSVYDLHCGTLSIKMVFSFKVVTKGHTI